MSSVARPALVLCLVLQATAPAVANGGLAALAPGFYRHNNDQTVYRVNDGAVCAIISEAQLRAFGETDKAVRVVDNSIDFLNGKAKVAECLWPDGYYHVRGANFVVRVTNDTACVQPSTDERTTEVDSTDVVTAGRKFVGRCSP